MIGIAAITMATVVLVAMVVQNASGWMDNSTDIRSIHDDVDLEMKEKLFGQVNMGKGKNLCLSFTLI